MIKVRIEEKENKVTKITLLGHALYDDYGKDIVCAAVSSTVLCTINGILAIDSKALEVETEKDKLIINIKKDSLVTTKLINNMIRCLTSIENDYPKNIKIN